MGEGFRKYTKFNGPSYWVFLAIKFMVDVGFFAYLVYYSIKILENKHRPYIVAFIIFFSIIYGLVPLMYLIVFI